MEPIPQQISQILNLLTEGPLRIEAAAKGVEAAILYLRTEAEPWSVSDILAHLRACSDVWGTSLNAMLTQDNPTIRYKSPRSSMKKPMYADQEFKAALASFTSERQKLVKVLANLDETGWLRRGTFSGTSPRQRSQTVLSYAERIINHEQPHLDQIESLLQLHTGGGLPGVISN